MSEIPAARVARGGEGGDERRAGAEVAPVGPVLRLAPRALGWRLIFGNVSVAFGLGFAAFGMSFVLLFLPQIDLDFAAHDRQAQATITSVDETGGLVVATVIRMI